MKMLAYIDGKPIAHVSLLDIRIALADAFTCPLITGAALACAEELQRRGFRLETIDTIVQACRQKARMARQA